MKKFLISASVAMVSLLALGFTNAQASDNSVAITEPADGATVASPVKVCMETHGVEVEPAKNGVNDGKGHHHLLVDVDVPGDLSKPIGKDDNHVHMGDGSTCKELELGAGKHSITALFAKGNHVPYSPAISNTIHVTLK